MTTVALVGFGEVGQRLASDLRRFPSLTIVAWDVLFHDPRSAPSIASGRLPVRAARSMADAIGLADVVICAVTAAHAVEVAREAAAALRPSAWFVDLNSISPRSRTEAAALVEAVGARYVEAVVMSPIHPLGLESPMLLGGPHAAAFDAPRIGLTNATVHANELGTASAAKMCRSVVIKGLEALLTEALVAARHYGVEDTVLKSLDGLLPAVDWPRMAHYMIGRSIEHGARRAAEMREVAATVRAAGLDPLMSLASVDRHAWAAGRVPLLAELTEQLDALLQTRDPPRPPPC